MTNFVDSNEIVARVLAAHRRISEPIRMRYHGYTFVVYPGVFSPFLAPSGYLSLSLAAWPIFGGQRVLDVGCGAGVFTCLVALSGALKVVGIDITLDAVENARRNVAGLRLNDAVEIRQGDLFGPVEEGEAFDIIFADLPFSDREPEDDLERAFFDRNLASVRKFIRGLPNMLRRSSKGVRAYLCLSNLEPLRPPMEDTRGELDCRLRMKVSAPRIVLLLYELRLRQRLPEGEER